MNGGETTERCDWKVGVGVGSGGAFPGQRET